MMRKLISKITPEKIKGIYRRLREKRESKREIHIQEFLLRKGQSFIMLPSYGERRKDNKLGDVRYYSQMNQDMYLDNCVFNNKIGGVFLDVGGNDPVDINNTYFFEKNRDWTGLAFEPMPTANEKWKKERKVECLPYAIGNEEKSVEFCEYDDNAMSGLAETVDYEGKVNKKYTVQMRRLGTVLREKGITYVDFMSLDVEGAELEVLEGIDFDAVYIYCIVIENNKGEDKEKAIRRFLVNAGFKMQARLWIDDVWINQGELTK